MANTLPTFFRKFEVFAPFKDIIEPVQITLGFSGVVDGESGMILNLADIDSWINSFKKIGFKKKSYSDHWNFSRIIYRALKKNISVKELSSVQFGFLDQAIIFSEQKIFVEWQQLSVLLDPKKKWKAQTILTMELLSKKWPPLNSTAESNLKKKLLKVDLRKTKWELDGFQFSSWVYFDSEIQSLIKLT